MAPETVLLVASLAGAWALGRAVRAPRAQRSRQARAHAIATPLGCPNASLVS